MTRSNYDTALTVNMHHQTRKKLRAISTVLGLSGESEVVRAVLDGRLPALDEIPAVMFRTQRQHELYQMEISRAE